MNEVWVVNASPVIVLAKVGHLQLLEQLPGELLLPMPVAMEIQSGPRSDAARQALEGGWGVRVTAGRIPSELVEWGLGPGETAVLGVALERAHCTAVLDDASARACASLRRWHGLGYSTTSVASARACASLRHSAHWHAGSRAASQATGSDSFGWRPTQGIACSRLVPG